ncbi:MAG: hypothetical protein ACK4FY_03130 [Aquificaceae bacterium]
MKVLKLAQLLFDPSIQSWHIFRKYRIKRVYKILREYQLYMLRLLILTKLLLGKKIRYGMLMMVLCDRDGVVYDVWITFGSMHEVRAFRERKKKGVYGLGGLWRIVRCMGIGAIGGVRV